MKVILSIIISSALVVSGFCQTRNVLVGTNNTVVQPANFWSADASNARTGLGLGTAATSPASSFQPSSTILSNLSLGNGSGLTNVTASSVSFALAISNTAGLQAALDTKLATNGSAAGLTNFPTLNQNTTGTASNVTGVVSLASGGTGATNASSARTSLGGTIVGANLFTLINPDDVRFLRINANNTVSALTAADFRTAISVGTNLGTVTSVGMTVPAIFSLSASTITSSGTFGLTLTNQSSRQAFLAPNGGGTPAFRAIESDDLPSLAISKIAGLQTALDEKLATSGTATLATNVIGVVALNNGGTGGTNAESGRTGLGATTVGSAVFTLANPSAVRFLRYNADNTVSALSDSDFRAAIGLGTAATNPASAFQPASSVLTNLASSNGASLTNISVSNVIGALATNGNGAELTNLTAANITGTAALASNVTGVIAISNGGSGATNAGGARTNLGLGATNQVTFNQLTVSNNLLVGSEPAGRLQIGNTNSFIRREVGGAGSLIVGFETNTWTFNNDGVLSLNNGALSFGSTTNASQYATATRTNLGLGWPALTNTTASGFQAALFGTNTNPVLVNTNGEVVSPANFWQVAPITTTFIESQPTTNSTTNITASRFLHIHSLATNIINTTNTIVLPTNGSTFEGDMAMIVHKGPTNSTTQVRQVGSTNNLITLGKFNEAVDLTFYNNAWQLLETVAFTDPIYFSGTNAAANAAASRTNLGLGTTNSVQFGTLNVTNLTANPTANIYNLNVGTQITFNSGGSISLPDGNGIVFTATSASNTRTNLGLGATWLTNTNVTNFRTAIGLGATNQPTFSGMYVSDGTNAVFYAVSSVNVFELYSPLWFGDRNSTNAIFQFEVAADAAIARTNLGIPLAALTNTSVTNFQKAIFYTNTAPSNIGGNLGTIAAWIEIVASNGVTYKIPAYTNVP